jgi:hypothetical protein
MNRSILVLIGLALSVFAESPPDSLKDHITAGKDCDSFSYVAGNGTRFRAELPKSRLPTDYTPIGFVRQPSFVRGAGTLNKGEHSFVLYSDGDLIPQPTMLGYRYGIFYWWDIGYDVGANAGVFQTFVRTRMENLKTRKSEAFFWSNEWSAGYKIHDIALRDNVRFDDKSLVGTFDNSLAYRMGPARRASIYLLNELYVDYDLHSPRRQTDYYVMPAILGFEAMVGNHASFFAELGAAYSINGTQFADGSKLYDKTWFPTFRIGTALRTGSSTAIYYTRETKPLSRGKQPKPVY